MHTVNITKISLFSLALLLAFGVLGVTTVSAQTNTEDHKFERNIHRMRMHNESRFHLVPEDMRAEFRQEFKDLSEEERAELRERHRAAMSEHREEFEDFVGLSREELREVRRNGKTIGEVLADQGKTEADAEAFLVQQANQRVDNIIKRHNLDADEEQTLRDRIAEFVSHILDRWFDRV